jgi:signal transduction histidine kinase
MEQFKDDAGMLDLIIRPAFCVKDGVIIRINQAAQCLTISVGDSLHPMLHTGNEEYNDFQGGQLYLTLNIGSMMLGASVTRTADFDVFVLEQDSDQAELQSMALAARELREPLASVMTVADRLFPMISTQDDPTAQDQLARINRGLFQMLRVISNMSDAARYTQPGSGSFRMCNITAVFTEIFEKAAALVNQTDVALHFSNLNEDIYSLIDEEKLERAIYNLLSNAVKFTPRGGFVEARLTRKGVKLYLTVQDNGSGVDPKIRGNVYTRYLRQPSVEDKRFGIGLGMVLIRSAAAIHGGTVLMENPEGPGTRITMSMTIRQDGSNLRSRILTVDYAGERDHGLIELSESLPVNLYEKEYIN